MAILNIHKNIRSTLFPQLETGGDIENNVDFTDTTKGFLLQDAFKFCLTSNEELSKSIEKQQDCPSVSILDDIISTSLITNDIVMDCY